MVLRLRAGCLFHHFRSSACVLELCTAETQRTQRKPPGKGFKCFGLFRGFRGFRGEHFEICNLEFGISKWCFSQGYFQFLRHTIHLLVAQVIIEGQGNCSLRYALGDREIPFLISLMASLPEKLREVILRSLATTRERPQTPFSSSPSGSRTPQRRGLPRPRLFSVHRRPWTYLQNSSGRMPSLLRRATITGLEISQPSP